MKYTNKHNLPPALFKALTTSSYSNPAMFSATELIRPVQMSVLIKRNDNKIEVDASDNLWMLLGTAIHETIEKQEIDGHQSEVRLTHTFFHNASQECSVGGQVDEILPDDSLTDWKCTSVYSFLMGDKPDWMAQMNIYAELARRNGLSPPKLTINAVLRDWSAMKAGMESNYPKIPFISTDIPMWSSEKATAYIHDRLDVYLKNDKEGSESLSPCSTEEKWERPRKYAVMKKGGKRAIRLFDEEAEAHAHVHRLSEPKGALFVQLRGGEKVRCDRYCLAKTFCHQYAQER